MTSGAWPVLAGPHPRRCGEPQRRSLPVSRLGLPCRTIYLSLAVLLVLLLLVIAQSQSGGGAGAPTKSRAYTQLDASKAAPPPSPRDYIAQARAARERGRCGGRVSVVRTTLKGAVGHYRAPSRLQTPCHTHAHTVPVATAPASYSPSSSPRHAPGRLRLPPPRPPPCTVPCTAAPNLSRPTGTEGLEGGQGGAAGKEVGAGESPPLRVNETVPARLLASLCAHMHISPAALLLARGPRVTPSPLLFFSSPRCSLRRGSPPPPASGRSRPEQSSTEI